MKGIRLSEGETIEETVARELAGKERALALQAAGNKGRTLYKREANQFKEDELRALIGAKLEELAEFSTREQIKLTDTAAVKRRSVIYLKACQKAGTFPSNIGLAHALGYSARHLRYFRERKAAHDTAKWLDLFSELCADILTQSALRNNCNAIVSIFISKAVYGFREQSEVIISSQDAYQTRDEIDIEEIRARYLPQKGEKDGNDA